MKEGVEVHGSHTVRGEWGMYVGTVEDMMIQKDRTGYETRVAMVQWEDQEEGDEERLLYVEARGSICPRGREMEIQEQLVPEQEAQELKGEEMSSGMKNKKKK